MCTDTNMEKASKTKEIEHLVYVKFVKKQKSGMNIHENRTHLHIHTYVQYSFRLKRIMASGHFKTLEKVLKENVSSKILYI